jgi:hypothetical protein
MSPEREVYKFNFLSREEFSCQLPQLLQVTPYPLWLVAQEKPLWHQAASCRFCFLIARVGI